MANLNSILAALPQVGTSLISLISEYYQGLSDTATIPAFHAEEGAFVCREGTIFLNNEPLEAMVDHPRPHQDLAFWLGMSHSLTRYRNWYAKEVVKRKHSDAISEADLETLHAQAILFYHALHHILGKVYRKLKRRFDETTDGLAFHLDDEGCLTINGMRVDAFLQMAYRYPTAKAHTFLRGLKSRLAVILANRGGNPNYDKIRETTLELFAEIDQLLGNYDPTPLALPAA